MTTTAPPADRFLSSLAAYVHAHASVRPDAPALIGTGRASATYQQLDRHLDRVGAALAAFAPAADCVIAVAAANGPELLTAIVAAMSAGVCAPFDPNRPPVEIDAYLGEIRPALVLADEAAILRHRDAFDRHGVRVVRMIAEPGSPTGVFDVVAEAPYPMRERGPRHDEDVALLLRTSGTTGFSKVVPHTMARLMHVVTSIVRAVRLGPDDRCLNATPFYHVHALVHVVGASLVAGASVVCPAEIGAAALVDGLRTYRPTWYTASPAGHRDVLAYVRRETAPREHALRFIRSSSAPLDKQVAIGLEAAFGVPVLEGYGATEAPSATLNPPPPLVHKPGSVGPAMDCEIAILDGEVAIRGANVAPSYAGGTRGPIADPVTGWYRTGDAGYLDADGYLYITGRLDELINVGGVKVPPKNVETALLTHPLVADAVAFSLPHPTLGQHVAAAVVTRPGASVTAAQLAEHVAPLLPRPAIPNVMHLVEALPRDGAGKVRRRDLSTAFARNAPVDPSPTGDDALLGVLARIWEGVLEYAPVALDEDFFAAGGDSLRAIRVMTRIEAEVGIALSPDLLLFAPTIRTLAQAVRSQASHPQSNRIVTLRASGTRPPLFFYDSDVYHGGLYARVLLAVLDPEQPVYVVRPNGALGDAIPESIEQIADADAVMIATAVPAGAYRLAGFCAGGVVGFEVARRLERAGASVDVVALIASSAPNALLEPLWALTSRWSRWLPERAAARLYRAVRSVANALRTRSAPVELLDGLRDLRRPPVPIMPADQVYSDRLLRYFPKRTGRTIDLIWAADDIPKISGDATMGWRHVARVRRHSVGGTHATVLTEHIEELGTVLRGIVDAADRNVAPIPY